MIEIVVAGSTRLALLDDEFASLQQYRWRLYRGTVFRYGDKRIKLSHAIAGLPPKGLGIVHANGDRFDFRRDNLVAEPLKKNGRRAGQMKRLLPPTQGDLFAPPRIGLTGRISPSVGNTRLTVNMRPG